MRKTRIVKYSESADRPCKQRKVCGGRVVCLNDDVLMEILARLPVKSVIRFKLVCKSWLSLFCSDQFRRLHTLRCRKSRPSVLLTTIVRKEISFMKVTVKATLYYSNPNINRMIPLDITTIKNCKILSCSNGLVLLECQDDYYVHNPVTKQSKKLRLANNDYKFVNSLHIVFDPSKSPHYNIVCVRYDYEPDDRRYQIEVFNSESGTWRVCVEPFISEEVVLYFNACVQIKNFIYLIQNHTYGRVYCFDIEKNVSRLIDFPVPSVAAYTHSIQESNGSLYYCALQRDRQHKLSAVLWKLQVNGDDPSCSEWLFKCRHRLRFQDMSLRFHLITYIGETCTMLVHTPGKIVAYNFRDKSYKEILDLESKRSHVKFYKFCQTLALL